MTLLVSKKAGSQTEPLRPLLDKMWNNSGAVLQLQGFIFELIMVGKVPEKAKDAEESQAKAPDSKAASKVEGRPCGHPPSTKVDEEKVYKPEKKKNEIKVREGQKDEMANEIKL